MQTIEENIKILEKNYLGNNNLYSVQAPASNNFEENQRDNYMPTEILPLNEFPSSVSECEEGIEYRFF